MSGDQCGIFAQLVDDGAERHFVLSSPLPVLTAQPDDGAPHLADAAPEAITEKITERTRFVIRPLQSFENIVVVRMVDRSILRVGFHPPCIHNVPRPDLVFGELYVGIGYFFPDAAPQTGIVIRIEMKELPPTLIVRVAMRVGVAAYYQRVREKSGKVLLDITLRIDRCFRIGDMPAKCSRDVWMLVDCVDQLT